MSCCSSFDDVKKHFIKSFEGTSLSLASFLAKKKDNLLPSSEKYQNQEFHIKVFYFILM
jgi:hypothetical protein